MVVEGGAFSFHRRVQLVFCLSCLEGALCDLRHPSDKLRKARLGPTAAGAASATCTSPPLHKGHTVFDEDGWVQQHCAGSGASAIAPLLLLRWLEVDWQCLANLVPIIQPWRRHGNSVWGDGRCEKKGKGPPNRTRSISPSLERKRPIVFVRLGNGDVCQRLTAPRRRTDCSSAHYKRKARNFGCAPITVALLDRT